MPGIFHQAGCCCAADWKLTPCLEPAPSACLHCSVTPEYYTVTFAGITICNKCYWVDSIPVNRYFKVISPSSFSGTFVLPNRHLDIFCSWQQTTTGTFIAWEFYGGINCTGGIISSGSSEVFATAQKGPDGIRVFLTIETAIPGGGGTTVTMNIYRGTESGAGNDCLSDRTINNDFSACATGGPNPNFAGGHSGTAIVVAGDVGGGGACPGGAVIYTNTDLASFEDDAVTLDDGVCYLVEANDTNNGTDGDVTVVNHCDNCADCCGCEDAAAWDGGTTYALNDYVTSGGDCYRSIQNNNLNHAPPNATWWAKECDE